jgi:hypothetical protein
MGLIGHDMALIASDDHAGKAGGKFAGLRNDPDSRLGAARTPYHAADIVAVDGDRTCTLRASIKRRRYRRRNSDRRRGAQIEMSASLHVGPLW